MVDKIMGQPKRLFITLTFMSITILAILFFLVWFIPFVGLKTISPFMPLIFGSLLVLFFMVILFGTSVIIIAVWRGKDFGFSYHLRGAFIKILFPIMIFLGKLVGIPREKVQQSFIEVNNQLIRSKIKPFPPEKLLLLLPHCIQNFDCKVKITGNIYNCKRCGKCKIKDFIEFAETIGIHVAVATGGTLARRIIVEKRPKAIVAVACEYDLTTGIQDSYPLPVLGILNERPFGPCINTTVDVKKVKEAIFDFLGKSMDDIDKLKTPVYIKSKVKKISNL
ncbi:MAG: DUF116 domain-containing protein [Deltaproteobacteria bacterium]|nr:DUF116 domain-containing protein [Deltaproteobacteria bacterium]